MTRNTISCFSSRFPLRPLVSRPFLLRGGCTVTALPVYTTDTLTVRPWPDDVIDLLGHDPRSAYVETYWLGILGPSTTWLLRRLVAGLESSPAGYELPLSETASCLGLGNKGGRHSPFMRSLARCVQFHLAQYEGEYVLAVRRKVPPLNRRQIMRLPESLQLSHQEWQESQVRTPLSEQQRQRGRHLALSLFQLGEDVEAVERQLLRWKYHPAMAREVTAWAWDRHRAALAAGEAAAEAAG